MIFAELCVFAFWREAFAAKSHAKAQRKTDEDFTIHV